MVHVFVTVVDESAMFRSIYFLRLHCATYTRPRVLDEGVGGKEGQNYGRTKGVGWADVHFHVRRVMGVRLGLKNLSIGDYMSKN